MQLEPAFRDLVSVFTACFTYRKFAFHRVSCEYNVLEKNQTSPWKNREISLLILMDLFFVNLEARGLILSLKF